MKEMNLKVSYLALFFTSNILLAQDDLIQNQINMEQDKIQRENSRKSELPKPIPKTTLEIESTQKIEKTKTDSTNCFDIEKTVLKSDIELLPPTEIYEKLNGKCVNVEDIQVLMSDINKFYQENNLITTRVYAPEQNLSNKELNLVVINGKLAGYAYADGSDVDYRLLNAFPIEIDETINLRELEQGVDNFNRLQSQKGKIKLVPAQNQGESYLVMEQQQTKPWSAKIGVDNSGYKTTGRYKALGSFSYDNLLNLNDNINIDYSTNLDDEDNKKRANSGSLNYSISYGDWLYSYSHSRHIFHRIIQGVNQQYYVNGFSDSDTLGLNKLVYRDQSARVNLYSKLSIKESKNYIEHYEIETQRRNLTILDVGVSGDDVIENASINYDLGAKFGLNILNGMEDIPGTAESKTKTLHSKISLKLPFDENNYSFNSDLGGQYSEYELAGSEQFGVGGRYDVRGFHEDNLYGNSGIYLRNEIETKNFTNEELKIRYFLGFDIGAVKRSATINWSDKELAGISTGARFSITEYLNGDLTISKAVKRPQEFESSKEQVYFNINCSF